MTDEIDKLEDAAVAISGSLGKMIPRMEGLVAAINKETGDDGASKRSAMVIDPQKSIRIKKQLEDLKNHSDALQRKQHELESLIKSVQALKNKPGVKGAIQKVNPLAGKKEAALLKTLNEVLDGLKKAIKSCTSKVQGLLM